MHIAQTEILLIDTIFLLNSLGYQKKVCIAANNKKSISISSKFYNSQIFLLK